MLNGIGVSKGYGIGRVVIATEAEIHFIPKDNCDPALEHKRFSNALNTFTIVE